VKAPDLGNMQVSPVLSAAGLSAGYRLGGGRTRAVLSGLDLELAPGELVCLLGPNGAGKSTLMRTLAGLQPPLAGTMRWSGGAEAAPGGLEWARRAAIVLTERVEGGNLTVYNLAALGRYPHTAWTGRLLESDRSATQKALVDAGAWDLRDRRYDELSDGEKQKVMLARALAQDPLLLLLDEPTAFLDLPRRVETMRVLRRLAREQGRAVLLSTHDLDLALRASDRLWLLPAGGPMKTGMPEELVLRGDFAAVFDQGDVGFDAASGGFRIHGEASRRARIGGEALPVFWTARALEREGYASVSGDFDVSIEAGTLEGRPHWEWKSAGSSGASFSLWELISALRRSSTPPFY
jgi:iron complex transport system ATP-binding protein